MLHVIQDLLTVIDKGLSNVLMRDSRKDVFLEEKKQSYKVPGVFDSNI